MVFSKLFSSKPKSDLRAKSGSAADHLADEIGLEFKGIVSQAVLKTLERKEALYLTRILEKSVFLIESLVITPLDKQAASALEKFLQLHTDIDPSFKTSFFRSIMEKEYRSPRGATVLVAADMEPSIQFNALSLETPTEEESFQISLRGRRVSYAASVSLKGPIARTSPEAREAQDTAKTTSGAASFNDPGISGALGRSFVSQAAEGLLLKIKDQKGERLVEARSPLLIGREAPTSDTLGNLQFVPLYGTYVSRRHLVVVNVAEDTYFFLHDAATLSCMTSGDQVLRPASLYSLPRGAEIELIFGASAASRVSRAALAEAADFPIVEIRRSGSLQKAPSQATPRPRAV